MIVVNLETIISVVLLVVILIGYAIGVFIKICIRHILDKLRNNDDREVK